MIITPVSECNQETSVDDGLHFFEKPFRVDRLGGPEILPASRRNGRSSTARAFSNWSRMILPCDTPAFAAVSFSHSARSSGRRTVIVLPICIQCNTRILIALAKRTIAKLFQNGRHYAPPGIFRFKAKAGGDRMCNSRHGG